MAIDNLSAKVEKFSDDYEHKAAQTESRVASLFKQKQFTGEAYNDDFIGTISEDDIIENRATGAATANKVIKFTRRKLEATTLTWSTYKSEKDVVEMFKDPQQEVIVEMNAVMNRKRDIIACNAAIGNARSFNQTSGAWEDAALPADKKITEAGTDGMTLAKLKATKLKFDDEELPDEHRYMVLTAKGLLDLLDNTEVTSTDYNTVKALVRGEVDEFMGFKFVRFKKLPKTGNIVSGIAFYGPHCMFGENMTRTVDVEKDPGHSMDYAIQIEEQVGALRRTDQGVVEVQYYEAA